MAKLVEAFVWGEHPADVANGADQVIECSRADAAQVSLELGERHFDGIQVWAVGREKEEPARLRFQRRIEQPQVWIMAWQSLRPRRTVASA